MMICLCLLGYIPILTLKNLLPHLIVWLSQRICMVFEKLPHPQIILGMIKMQKGILAIMLRFYIVMNDL